MIPQEAIRRAHQIGDRTIGRARGWYRLLNADNTPTQGIKVTLSGLPPTWEYEYPGPFAPGVIAEKLSRGDINATWWVPDTSYVLDMFFPLEPTALVLPLVMASRPEGVSDFLDYLRLSSPGSEAYDVQSEAEEFGVPPPEIYERTVTPEGGEPGPAEGAELSLFVDWIEIVGSKGGVDEMMVAVVGSRSTPHYSSAYGPLTDVHVFDCKMTGKYTFAGTEIGGAGELTGEYMALQP